MHETKQRQRQPSARNMGADERHTEELAHSLLRSPWAVCMHARMRAQEGRVEVRGRRMAVVVVAAGPNPTRLLPRVPQGSDIGLGIG